METITIHKLLFDLACDAARNPDDYCGANTPYVIYGYLDAARSIKIPAGHPPSDAVDAAVTVAKREARDELIQAAKIAGFQFVKVHGVYQMQSIRA